MSELVQTFFKDSCGCGCGLQGGLRKPWRDGVQCVRLCKCRRCLGARNRRKGLSKQTVARKALGVAPSNKFGDANEENWKDAYFANEVKAGAQCGPLANWWRRVEKQAQANEADFGDRKRPVRGVAMPAGWSDGLVVVRLSTWNTHVRPALEEFYGSGE